MPPMRLAPAIMKTFMLSGMGRGATVPVIAIEITNNASPISLHFLGVGFVQFFVENDVFAFVIVKSPFSLYICHITPRRQSHPGSAPLAPHSCIPSLPQ